MTLFSNKINLHKKPALLKFAALLLFLLFSVSIFRLLDSYSHIKKDMLFLTPVFSDANGWHIYTLEEGVRRELSTEEMSTLVPGKTFYLSRILTQEMEESGYTFLLLDSLRPCAVFLDGELLYTTCPDVAIQMDAVTFPNSYTGLSARGESVRCTLPMPYAGRTLTIATTQIDLEYASPMPGVKLSSQAVDSELVLTAAADELLPAAGFAVLALFLTGIWVFACFQEIYDYPSLLLIATMLMQSLSHLRQLDFILPSSTAMDSPLALFIPTMELCIPLFWLLLQIKEKRYRRIFCSILGICTCISLITPVARLFGGLPFYSHFLEANTILYCTVISLLIIAVLEARAGNTDFRQFLLGLGIVVSGIAILYVCSLFGTGFYANLIANIFGLMFVYHDAFPFLHWCAIILLALCAFLFLSHILNRTLQTHTDLLLQQERAKLLDSQLSVQKQFYEAKLSHEKEIRALRHDMAGHLNTLGRLLNEASPAAAKHYLDGVAEYHNEQISKLYSANPYINAVLQNYAAECFKQHVELICHIGIGKHELPVTELCLILNNALENALEASLKLPQSDRKIKVQAAVRQNLFLLRVSNRFDGHLSEECELPLSTKEGTEHGYGLSNIRQAAERRDGSLEYYVRNGYFVLDVTLSVTNFNK